MARYGQDKIEEIRTRADIVEVIGTHVRLRRAGRNWVGLCPFHDEKTPSFSVNSERGFFHCFGCGAGGTVFDFVMRMEAMSFPEAMQSLAQRFGISLPPPQQTSATEGSTGERERLFSANQTAAEFYAHVLWKTPDGGAARDYLKSRGVTTATAESFMLGFAPARPANLAAALGKRSLTEAGLKLGLIKKDERGAIYDMFRARLMFPIRDAQGRTMAFGGRVLDERLPKYINSPESPLYSKGRAVYGLHEARQAIVKADRAIIVEGNIDAIMLWQAGFKETVATLGTALTSEQLRLLARYSRNLIACFDGDAAGRKASMRALEVFLQAGLLGRGAFIPSGFDPDTLVRQRGAQAFSEVIEAAELLVDYFIKEQAAAAENSLEGRARAAERVAQVLSAVTNPFEFDLLARKAAGMLGVGEEILRREARKQRPVSRGTRNTSLPANRKQSSAAGPQAELGLIAIALRWPELKDEIWMRVSVAESDGAPLNVLKQVCTSTEPQASLEVLLSEQMTESQRAELSALMIGPLLNDPEQSRALMEDYIGAIMKARQRSEVETLCRIAATERGDEAAATAQAVIALRQKAAERTPR